MLSPAVLTRFEVDLQDFTELVGVHDLLDHPTFELIPVGADLVLEAIFSEGLKWKLDAGRGVNALMAATRS